MFYVQILDKTGDIFYLAGFNPNTGEAIFDTFGNAKAYKIEIAQIAISNISELVDYQYITFQPV